MLFQSGSLLMVIVVAYALKHLHVFGEHDYKVAQAFAFNLTLPCAIVLSFATNKHDMSMLWIVLFGFLSALIPLFVVFLGTHGDETRYRAFEMLNASGLNLGAFCLPVAQTLIGPSAGLPVVMMDVGNAIVATAAALSVTKSLLHMDDAAANLPIGLKLRNIARDFVSSLSFDTYMLMLMLMIAHVTIPQWIVQLVTPFANANAFVTMAMVGLMMEVPSEAKDRLALLKVIVWRAGFAVVIGVAGWYLLPIDPSLKGIMLLCAASPVTVFSTKFTESLTGNPKLAGFSLTVTGLISLAAMTAIHMVVAGA